jgi:hypothetical protein
MRAAWTALAAIAAGFVLSFGAMGLFWVAMAWPVQALVVLPFGAVAWVLARWSGNPRRAALLVLLGAAPLGLLFTLFRDREGSHLMPVLMVVLWVLGVVAGASIAASQGDEPAGPDQAGE